MSDDRTTVLEEPHEDEEYDDEYRGPGRMIALAAVVAVALGVAGYFAGHASAGGGPATLADAVKQAQDGKLACGDTGTAGSTTPPAAAGAPPGAGGGGSDFLVRAVCQRDGAGAGAGAGAPGGGAGRGGFGGGGGVVGQVQSLSGDTLTIQGRQGTVKLKLSASTTVRKNVAGALGDVKPGATVTVAGTGQNNQNPATSITILPATQ